MPSNRLGLTHEQADRYLVTWSEGDLTASLKQALKVRRFALRLDYTTHTPMLFIVDAAGKEHLWRTLDTRCYRNFVVTEPAMNVDVQAFADHVNDSLNKLGFRIQLGHRRDKVTRKQEALLLVVSPDSRHWVLSMIAVPKGGSKKVVGDR